LRVGICFFIESNLGGAATQADDLVTVARRLGHEACLLRFTSSPRGRELWDPSTDGLPDHTLVISRAGMRFVGPKVYAAEAGTAEAASLNRRLDTFDLLVFVGGCPHQDVVTDRKKKIGRRFGPEDFHRRYGFLYTRCRARKVMFLTDPFWRRLYPYCADVVGGMDRVYAFAQAYRRSVVESGLRDDVEVCNFGSVAACDLARNVGSGGRRSKDEIVWPHQWRSWKNPLLFVRTAPYLWAPVRAYADGIEYHLIRRDHPDDWEAALAEDRVRPRKGEGSLTYYGTVPQPEILAEFATCRWMIDLTGVSGRTGNPLEQFVGNYQCVNIECMMLGCVNLKYENTIEPYSLIPSDCVLSLPLEVEPIRLAALINERLSPNLYEQVSARAKEWSMKHFDPVSVFRRCFLEPFGWAYQT